MDIFLYQDASISWWKMLLLGLFFLFLNASLFTVMWYVRKHAAIEYGYPKLKKKAIQKIQADYSFLDQLLLIRITLDAKRQGFFLYLNLICHFANLLGLCGCLIGFIGAMVTLADGWALTLLIKTQLVILFYSVLIEFIPHLIWLPSERKRYKV
jgi:hypothetical protein